MYYYLVCDTLEYVYRGPASAAVCSQSCRLEVPPGAAPRARQSTCMQTSILFMNKS
jgi:hypothetical protein